MSSAVSGPIPGRSRSRARSVAVGSRASAATPPTPRTTGPDPEAARPSSGRCPRVESAPRSRGARCGKEPPVKGHRRRAAARSPGRRFASSCAGRAMRPPSSRTVRVRATIAVDRTRRRGGREPRVVPGPHRPSGSVRSRARRSHDPCVAVRHPASPSGEDRHGRRINDGAHVSARPARPHDSPPSAGRDPPRAGARGLRPCRHPRTVRGAGFAEASPIRNARE